MKGEEVPLSATTKMGFKDPSPASWSTESVPQGVVEPVAEPPTERRLLDESITRKLPEAREVVVSKYARRFAVPETEPESVPQMIAPEASVSRASVHDSKLIS